jgi:hypothetical protein
MDRILYKWLTDGSWGFLRFLLDGFTGLLWSFWRWIVVWCWTGVGLAIADYLDRNGVVNVWAAFPFTTILVLVFVWAGTLGRILLFFPFPLCRNGKCRGIKAYLWPIGTVYGRWRWGDYRYQCLCGHEYVRKGRHFFYVLPDGSRQPYMTLSGFRIWTLAPPDGSAGGEEPETEGK